MDFLQASELKRFIDKNFSVNLHIHDTCGGLYLSIDEPNEMVKAFILAYCEDQGIAITVSEDGTSFFPKGSEKLQAEEEARNINVVFEADRSRSAAYKGDLLVGVCSFRESGSRWTIGHTWVDPSCRDLGIAGRLVEKVAEKADQKEKKIRPSCSYAAEWFGNHPEYKDLLA